MSHPFRWPAAIAGLGLGLFGVAVNDRLVGQPVPQLPAAAVALPRDAFSLAPVVKRVAPAVVSIEGKLSTPPRPGDRRPAAPLDPSVDPGFGSGVIVDPSGVVLTNHHVVADAETVTVTLADGRTFTTKDIRRDPQTDLAVLKLTADKPLPFVEIGDSDAMEVGDRVLAVGAPFGLTGSVTHGIVSAKNRHDLRLNPLEDFLQTDAAVNPGNSGGPLVNLEGRVVGITSAIKTRSGGFQGVGLAVSSNLAKTVAAQLLADGVVRRGHLGVDVKDEAVNGGAGVNRVVANGPAAKAGMKTGDVITAVAGKPVRDGRELRRRIAELPLGKPAELTVTRDGRPTAVAVAVEEAPGREANKVVIPAGVLPPPAAGPGGAAQMPTLGLVVCDLSPMVRSQLGFPADARGVAVLRVEPRSVAAQAGLARGTVVVRVDRTPVTGLKDFREAILNADRTKGVVVETVRPNGESEFAVLRIP